MAAAKLSADAQRDHRRLEAVLEPKIADATAVQAKFNEMKEMWLEKSKEVEGLKKPLVKNGAMLRQVTASPADLQGIRVRRDGGTGGGARMWPEDSTWRPSKPVTGQRLPTPPPPRSC